MPTSVFSGDEKISVETQNVKSLSSQWVFWIHQSNISISYS